MSQTSRILLWGSNLWIFADGMLGPLFAVYAEAIGGSVLDITWAWAVYLLVTGIGVIIVGAFSDRSRLTKIKLLILGYSISALFTFAYLLVTTPFHLFLVQAGLGIGLALANPTWYALYSHHAPPESAGYWWGLADGQGKILTAIAIVAGGLIVQQFSFSVLFVLMGSIQLLAAGYQIKLLYDKTHPH